MRGRSHNSVFMISGVKAGVLVYTYGFMHLHLFKQKIIIIMVEPHVGYSRLNYSKIQLVNVQHHC